jgi:hypothetical protein
VELGIAGPARAMAEAGGQEPRPGEGVLAVSSPAHHTGFARQLVEDTGHGSVMGDGDGVTELGRAEGPQQRHTLGGREGEVVAGAAGGPAHDAEVSAVGGTTVEKVSQGLGVHFAAESDTGRGGADPLAGGLAVAEVVVVHRVGHTLEVVVGARGDPETSYREHRGAPHGLTTDGEPTMDRDHPGGRHLRRHLPSSWVGLHRSGARRHPPGTPTPAVMWPHPHSAGRNRPKGGGIHNAGV